MSPATTVTHMVPGPVTGRDEDRIRQALSELAGLDTSNVDLRDHAQAWGIMERLVKASREDRA